VFRTVVLHSSELLGVGVGRAFFSIFSYRFNERGKKHAKQNLAVLNHLKLPELNTTKFPATSKFPNSSHSKSKTWIYTGNSKVTAKARRSLPLSLN
jgi:hypothetical protein